MAPAAAWPPSASLGSIPPLGATAGAAHVRAQHFKVFVKGGGSLSRPGLPGSGLGRDTCHHHLVLQSCVSLAVLALLDHHPDTGNSWGAGRGGVTAVPSLCSLGTAPGWAPALSEPPTDHLSLLALADGRRSLPSA